MDRRRFASCCAGVALWSGLGAYAAEVTDYPRARLVQADGQPLRAAQVPADEALVFAYPYVGVPCYLLRLDARQSRAQALESSDEGRYTSPIGVGVCGQLVAFVAICTHQLSYPTPQISNLRYAAQNSELAGAAGCIVCCAHGSVFDPAAGGRRVSGPAPGPLLPVRLEYDAESDGLYATGTVADRLIDRFFAAYKGDLIDRYGPGAYRQPVGSETEVQLLSAYSRKVTTC